ncbi:MAG: alpha/beta fold hydrolase, partial [Solirubrobacteraceae bacterium]
WDRLGELAMPVTVVVGERDERYRALGAELVRRIPRAELVTIAGGHRLALESPAALAAAISAPGS